MLEFRFCADMMKHFLRRYQRLLAVVFFLFLLAVIFQLSGLRGNFNLAFLQRTILANQDSGLLIFVLLFALGNLIQIPGWLFLASAVLTLGKITGGMATYIAAIFSCVTTFVIIRGIGGDALRTLESPLAARILRRLDSHPIRSVMLLRMLFQTIPALNYALALSGIPFWKYLLGTVLGLPLPIALYCLFFDYLATVIKLV